MVKTTMWNIPLTRTWNGNVKGKQADVLGKREVAWGVRLPRKELFQRSPILAQTGAWEQAQGLVATVVSGSSSTGMFTISVVKLEVTGNTYGIRVYSSTHEATTISHLHDHGVSMAEVDNNCGCPPDTNTGGREMANAGVKEMDIHGTHLQPITTHPQTIKARTPN